MEEKKKTRTNVYLLGKRKHTPQEEQGRGFVFYVEEKRVPESLQEKGLKKIAIGYQPIFTVSPRAPEEFKAEKLKDNRFSVQDSVFVEVLYKEDFIDLKGLLDAAMEKKHRLVDLHYETNTFTTQDGREIHFKNVTRMAINFKVEQEQEVQALVDSFKGELSKKKEQVKEEEVDTKKTEIEEEFNEEELDFGDADIPF
jgi:hypothetical protein